MMKKLALITVLIALTAAVQAESQGPSAVERRQAAEVKGRLGPRNMELRKLLEQIMIARISQELALDDEQTVLLVRNISAFRDQQRAQQKELRAMRARLKKMLESVQDADKIDVQLEAIQKHDKKMVQREQEFFDAISADLTTWQRARLYLFLKEFEEDMRRLIAQARQQRQQKQRISVDGQKPDQPYREELPTKPNESPEPKEVADTKSEVSSASAE